MATQTASTTTITPTPAFTLTERRLLRALRARYQQDRDLFSDGERARLRFMRWLCRTGRLVP